MSVRPPAWRERLRGRLDRLVAPGERVGLRELALLAGAILVGLAVQLAYAYAMRHHPLAGDAPEYDSEGVLISHGLWWYTRLPYGILHAGAWKAPLYPAWIGLWYALLGHHPEVVRVVQVLLGGLTIPLTWLLARRLFGVRVAVAAAVVVALYPLAWQFEALFYPEALATPLYVLLLLLIMTRRPGCRRSAGIGLLLGVAILLRPSSVLLFGGALVLWSLRVGWRRGIGMTALAALAAVLVVTPWTVRNAIVMHGFLPISLEDAGLYGTFNSQSAHDPVYPYAWRRGPKPDLYLFNPRHPLSDIRLHADLIHNAVTYIENHPGALPAAFFWNGLTRLWDVRHQSHALAEVRFDGRSRLVTEIGLDIYYVLLPLCLVGLWRARRRRALVWGILALALSASIVFTTDSGTRYRAPLEPLIVVLACAGVLGAREPARRVAETAAAPRSVDTMQPA